MTREVEIAEPIIQPRPKEREVKPRPDKNDPWTVPAPYDPRTHPQPTPKGIKTNFKN